MAGIFGGQSNANAQNPAWQGQQQVQQQATQQMAPLYQQPNMQVGGQIPPALQQQVNSNPSLLFSLFQ
jgi:hypothetical protein